MCASLFECACAWVPRAAFGYNTKAETYGRTIGKYGNGFKSGSMRLGQDALVFTKPRGGTTKSCGFLSQTFLKDIAAEEVLIPMVTDVPHLLAPPAHYGRPASCLCSSPLCRVLT
jgi:hypothetical protein